MKRFFTLFLTFTLIINSVVAQNTENKHVFGVHTAAGFLNSAESFVTMLLNYDEIPGFNDYNVIFEASPVFHFTYDYGFRKFLSFGVAASSQRAYLDVTYIPDNLNFRINYTKSNFAFRALFHYANSGKLDLYSGLRLGFTRRAFIFNENLTDVVWQDWLGKFRVNTFSYQLVAFGLRYHFFKGLGAGGEIGLGVPYYASFGLFYRF